MRPQPLMPNEAVLQSLRDVLGADGVLAGDDLAQRRHADWSGLPAAVPLALLRPRSTQQVSQALAVCHRYRQPVVVQGGLSGLAGGACTQEGDVALSLERMNAIEEVDEASGTMTVQAGVTLQAVQERAQDQGLMFALDLGARGSCTIGGNLGTNAGGNRVIKYGMAREQVLDLEAVLADGRVVGGLRKMVKNNTGLDLKNLLIGSEGTLGVITRAVLRLRALPGAAATAFCGLGGYDSVTALLRRAQQCLPGGVSAFEVMWPGYYDYVMAKVPGVKPPLAGPHRYYVLLESTGGGRRHQEDFEQLLEDCLAQGIIENAAVAATARDALAFWGVRDAPAEFPRLMPGLIAFDVSFSIRDIGDAAQACADRLHANWPAGTALVYGHLGDGNLHLIVDVPGATDAVAAQVEALVYGLVGEYGGSVSAEHGIGLKKRQELGRTRSRADLDAMGAIKQALDPRNILNRGKLFPDEVIGTSFY